MYLWIFVCGILFAFYNAWGIGANDCANSFATSVGSKVLTLKQAIFVAAIFEFSGAVLMGALVTDAIRKKIVDRDVFEDNPGALMYGMLCADLSSAIWLTLATYFKWPVSTTHSIIGSIIGFSLAYGGADAIVWEKVGFVALSWVLSPFLAGMFSSSFFFTINKFIFNSKDPYKNIKKLFPLITFVTFFINVLFIIYKGSPQLKLDKLPLWIALVSSISVGIVTALLSYFIYVPYADKKIMKQIEDTDTESSNDDNNIKLAISDNDTNNNGHDNDTPLERTTSYIEALDNKDKNENDNDNEKVVSNNDDTFNKYLNIKYQSDKTIEENIDDGKKYIKYLEDFKLETKINTLHENAHKLDYKSEKLCSWIQIITACFSSFAHGSNDVANAIAPLATIYHIYRYNEIAKKTEVPLWILFIGGVGIVVGLATWGYKIINRMGRELTKISTSRGFIIELAAALTVIIATRIEMPVSTTHCQVGSIVGCGLVGGKKNIQWNILYGILFSWLITLPFTGLLSAGIFSYGYYSP